MRISVSLLISIAIHLTVYLGLELAPTPDLLKLANDSIELKIVGMKYPYVPQVHVPDSRKTLLARPRFNSLKNQRVTEETQANQRGKHARNSLKPSPILHTDDFKKFMNSQMAISSKGYDQPTDPYNSTLPMVIEGVKIGEITALNTDTFSFYSFFTRISPQVANRWQQNLESYAKTIRRMRNSKVLTEWVSVLELSIDQEGNYVTTVLERESGITALDYAAFGALKNATPFPNPPIQMADEDGIIRLRYKFTVVAPKRLAQSPPR